MNNDNRLRARERKNDCEGTDSRRRERKRAHSSSSRVLLRENTSTHTQGNKIKYKQRLTNTGFPVWRSAPPRERANHRSVSIRCLSANHTKRVPTIISTLFIVTRALSYLITDLFNSVIYVFTEYIVPYGVRSNRRISPVI